MMKGILSRWCASIEWQVDGRPRFELPAAQVRNGFIGLRYHECRICMVVGLIVT